MHTDRRRTAREARVLVLENREIQDGAKLLKERLNVGLGERAGDLPDEELDGLGRLDWEFGVAGVAGECMGGTPQLKTRRATRNKK